MTSKECYYCKTAFEYGPGAVDARPTCDCGEPATYSTRGYVRMLERRSTEMSEEIKQLQALVLKAASKGNI